MEYQTGNKALSPHLGWNYLILISQSRQRWKVINAIFRDVQTSSNSLAPSPAETCHITYTNWNPPRYRHLSLARRSSFFPRTVALWYRLQADFLHQFEHWPLSTVEQGVVFVAHKATCVENPVKIKQLKLNSSSLKTKYNTIPK